MSIFDMYVLKNFSLVFVWIKIRERLCGFNYCVVKFGGKWSEIFLIMFVKISVNFGESILIFGWIIINIIIFFVFLIYFWLKWNYIIIIIYKKYWSNNIFLFIIMLKYNEWIIDLKIDMNNKCEILLLEEG